MTSYQSYLPQKLQSPIVVSNPHSGLRIHPLRPELQTLPKEVLLRDADYEIHLIWENVCRELEIPWIRAQFHRYNLDLNRRAELNDDFVLNHPLKGKGETKGLFWTQSTKKESLNFTKLPEKTAQALIVDIWKPYYSWIETQLLKAHAQFGWALLIDGHSMPSKGDLNHNDKGVLRADIVPGNLDGASCPKKLNELVEELCQSHAFSCKFNEPYKGGNLTQHFSKNTASKFYALQIEVNRACYMNEETKELDPAGIARLEKFTRDLLLRATQQGIT